MYCVLLDRRAAVQVVLPQLYGRSLDRRTAVQEILPQLYRRPWDRWAAVLSPPVPKILLPSHAVLEVP